MLNFPPSTPNTVAIHGLSFFGTTTYKATPYFEYLISKRAIRFPFTLKHYNVLV